MANKHTTRALPRVFRSWDLGPDIFDAVHVDTHTVALSQSPHRDRELNHRPRQDNENHSTTAQSASTTRPTNRMTTPPMATPAFCAPTVLPSHCRRGLLARRPRSAPKCTTPPPAVHTSGLVLRPSTSPRFDSGSLSSPVVHRYLSDTGLHFVMWYSGRPRSWSSSSLTPPGTLSGFAGLALSDDGLVWQRVSGPLACESVLAPSEDWWTFDTVHLAVGSVAIDSNDIVRADAGVYFMYYSGGSREKAEIGGSNVSGARMAVGVAISKDGEHFTRVEGEHPSGAVLQGGEPGSFDEQFVAGPCVIRPRTPLRGGWRYVMHYFTFDKRSNRFAVGRAVSKDGLTFSRADDGPVLTGEGADFAAKGVSRCCVVEKNAGLFVMFVECVDREGVHRIAMCKSDDCEKWEKLQVVLQPGDGDAWDAAGVSHPNAVVVDDGKVRLYYVGRGRDHDIDQGQGTCIGVAESDGEDWNALRRIPTTTE